ncbi:MAG: sigma-70 family RNA polymerase sigma factor [Archangium sp.]|nr:sigma-70 family RNA polymerase sigma factor [Archangium sp.]
MPYLPSNRALLDRFRAGEAAALEEVYRHYAPGLARILKAEFDDRTRFSGGGLPLELADAMQETFARAFSAQTRLSYDGLSPFGAWLTGIAHNIIIDHFRKRQTAEVVSRRLTHSPESRFESSPQPDVATEENEAQRLLASFSGALEASERSLFVARYERRLSQDETAASLGLTRIQVRRAEFKLRVRLLEHLKRNGFLQEARMTGWGLDFLRPSVARKRSGT